MSLWMASAIDFVMIFVSLELVTMSFYVLVAFMRRNTFSLEAGVKYLILSALSTGFLVYGITWIFGITGETNLARVSSVLTHPGVETGPALFAMLLVLLRLVELREQPRLALETLEERGQVGLPQHRQRRVR